MAVQFNPDHTRGSEYNFDPSNVIVKPELNGRHELPDIEWLIASILDKGQLQPVVIRNEGGSPVLVAGFSRWRAVTEINKRKLAPVPLSLRCTYFKGSEFDGFVANIAENKARNETTPIDDAYNIDKLEKWGQSIDQIAAIYRQSPAWVKSRLKLITLEPEVKDAVRDGKIKASAAKEIAKLSAEQQREVAKKGGKISKKEIATATGKSVALTIKDIKKILRDTVQDEEETKEVREYAEELLKKIKGGQ